MIIINIILINVIVKIFMILVTTDVLKIFMFCRQLEKSSRTIEKFFWRVPTDDVYIGLFHQMRR